jgi:hypothetical protein
MTAITTTSGITATNKIQQLAHQHGIIHQHSQLDEWGDKISQLSDAEVQLDEAQWLLVELNRAGILIGKENIILHNQYLQECKE